MAWGRASSSSAYVRPTPSLLKPLPMPTTSDSEITATTILSLLLTIAILASAYTLSVRLLPPASTIKTRILFVWHLFSGLTHLIIEGSYLYNVFFVSYVLPTTFSASEPLRQPHFLTPPDVYFLKKKNQIYGAVYGEGALSLLWQEYARADRRWGGADLTIVSIELLTVFGVTAIAAWVCELLRRGETKGGMRKWFWMVIMATAELYGGWMTFCPEWLSGSPNLNTSNWMYLWVYLFFFNMLWVWFPLWILYEAYKAINAALTKAEVVNLMTFIDKKDG